MPDIKNSSVREEGSPINYVCTDGDHPDFVDLCIELNGFLSQLVGGWQNWQGNHLFTQLDGINDVIIAYDGTQPIGCGGFKHYDDGRAEIKRVFVREDYRNKGIARMIMERLAMVARAKDYHHLILETGELLAEAMKMYH
ncbi:MAG: GNAT family N-acetyltransferase, partial [Lachnospiraceae bacterium]|nr:GNAT family N-acetyltransferase [Lachnospiraceae bacterium]